jgi:acetyltransferase-like isoleucine patch superfamily enzyme
VPWIHILRRSLADPAAAIRTARALGRGYYYRLKFRLAKQRVVIGRRFEVYGSLEIRGPGTVIFGDRCTIISSRLAPTTIFTHAPAAVVRFGDQVQLTGTRFGCEQRIDVGNRSGLSDARLMDTDFHALEVYDQPRYNTRGASRPIVLGPNVWIGAAAMVLKGVTVGENSVVAAGAVVAQRVPPNVVVFGNPARVVWRLRGPSPSHAATPAGVSNPVPPDPQPGRLVPAGPASPEPVPSEPPTSIGS